MNELALQNNALTNADKRERMVAFVGNLVLSGLKPNTKRAYERALVDYIDYIVDNPLGINRMSVKNHLDELLNDGCTVSAYNQRLSAIKKFVGELAENGLVDYTVKSQVDGIKGIKQEGKKLGNWLTHKEVQDILLLPDTSTLKGLRDRAILAVLFGAGLRREELCNLKVNQIQMRENRWLIVDVVGKRGKVRSVPINTWIKNAIDSWIDSSNVDDYLFVSFRKGNHPTNRPLTSDAIYKLMQEYTNIAPHDARRTFAQLARKNGAQIDQIQQSLGHASVETTERYLGTQQDLQDAPSDYIKFEIE